MATLNEYRYEIFELLNIKSDDTEVANRFVDRLIASKRSAYIHNYLAGGKTISSNLVQALNCFDMEAVNTSTCCDELYANDCLVLRSKQKLPKFITQFRKPAITKIVPNDILGIPHNFVDYDAIPFTGNGRYNQSSIYFFIMEEYLWATSKNDGVLLMDKATVYGVLDDPLDAQDFACDGKPCWTPDNEYPLEEWMWNQGIKREIREELLGKQSLPVDDTNDNQDTATSQPLQGGGRAS